MKVLVDPKELVIDILLALTCLGNKDLKIRLCMVFEKHLGMKVEDVNEILRNG
jgi:hypothetical protein